MYLELEYKYSATHTSLSDFLEVLKNLSPEKELKTSSFDYYYTKNNDKNSFIRYRESDNPELTIKRKVNTSNWERIEVDLPLDKSQCTKPLVDAWVNLENYKENFRIYKSCFIFWVGKVNYVYYIVYDENLKEKGRFIEVEVNKKEVPALGLDKAKALLKDSETVLIALNISPQNRLKKSLFEMFVK